MDGSARASLGIGGVGQASALRFVPFEPDHLDAVAPGDAAARAAVDHLVTEYAWSALWRGRPLVSAGIVAHREARWGEAWALVAPDFAAGGDGKLARVWSPITSMVKAELARARADGLGLIECTVDARHPAALRWARRLGFEANGLRPGYAGRDCILFGYPARGAK